MSNYPTLKHAPLIEALIDIQVELADPNVFKSEDLAEFQRGLDFRLPSRNELSQFSIGIEQQVGKLPRGMPGVAQKIGYQFFSGSHSVQCRSNGFTYSRLNGYDSWPMFEEEAREYWTRYLNIVHVAKVTRIGLRFINRIGVPSNCTYSDYFRTSPSVTPTIAHSISSFLMRLVLPQPEGVIAIATLATEPTMPNSTTSTVVFDIDVFLENLSVVPTEAIWTMASTLRHIKNKIFFESLTQLAIKEFE